MRREEEEEEEGMSNEEDRAGDAKFYSSLHIFYLTASVITLAECFLTFLINTVNKTLREKDTTALANNLAGSSAILSSTSLVCNVYFMMESFPTDSSWPCLLLSVFVRYLHIVSSLSLACLSLERYVAICWPFQYFQLTRSRCRLLCLACWLAPCLLLVLPCISHLPTLCSAKDGVSITFLSAYTVLYTMGAISNFVFYVLVALEFQRERDSHAHDKNDKTERLLRTRTAESAIRVISFYVLLSLPHTIFPLIERLLPTSTSLPPHLKDFFHVSNRIHLLLLLPVYAWANTSVHQTIRGWTKTLRDRVVQLFHRSDRQQTAKEESYHLEGSQYISVDCRDA